MRKKYLKAGIGIAVGGALLVTSTFISLASGPSAYETLKQSIKDSKEFNNGTIDGNVKVLDNGKEVLDLSVLVKADEKSELASGKVNVKTESINKNFDFYAGEESVIIKPDDSDVYLKLDCDEKENKNYKRHSKMNEKYDTSPEMEELHEKIVDSLVGDLKKLVVEKKLDNGDKEISVEIKENQIPEIVNAVLSTKGFEHEFEKNNKENEPHEKYIEELFGINKDDFKVKEIVSDLKLKNIYLKTILNEDNEIKAVGIDVEVAGKDKDGNKHNQKLSASLEFSNINSTTIDTIDLKGKDVKEIDTEKCEMNRMGNRK